MISRRACSEFTYMSRSAHGGDSVSANGASLLLTTSRIYSRNPPQRRLFLLLQITWQKWARASNMSSSRRWGCPDSQHHSACFRGHLQCTGLVTRDDQQKTLVWIFVFTCWPFSSPQSTVVCLHVLLPVWSWAEQRWWCQPEERLSDCRGISLSPSCVNRD